MVWADRRAKTLGTACLRLYVNLENPAAKALSPVWAIWNGVPLISWKSHWMDSIFLFGHNLV